VREATYWDIAGIRPPRAHKRLSAILLFNGTCFEKRAVVFKDNCLMRELFSIRQIKMPIFPNANGEGNVHCNDHFEIVWIQKGSGIYRIGLSQTVIADNTLFFVKPKQLYQFRPLGAVEGYVLSFSDSFLDIEDQRSDTTYYQYLFKLFSATSGMAIGPSLSPDLSDLIDKMKTEFNSAHLFRMEMVRRYFKIFLLYLTRELEGSRPLCRPARRPDLVEKFMSLLDKNFKTHKMVSEYACDLLVTPSHLNEIIKKVTGYPAGHHIRLRLVLEAKRLGVYSDLPMKEIAYDLGFSDSAHFSKLFKAMTGKNFTDFKKQHLSMPA
jgi:AraC family transcriptional activator of pobA